MMGAGAAAEDGSAAGASNDIDRAATPDQTPFDSARAEMASALEVCFAPDVGHRGELYPTRKQTLRLTTLQAAVAPSPDLRNRYQDRRVSKITTTFLKGRAPDSFRPCALPGRTTIRPALRK